MFTAHEFTPIFLDAQLLVVVRACEVQRVFSASSASSGISSDSRTSGNRAAIGLPAVRPLVVARRVENRTSKAIEKVPLALLECATKLNGSAAAEVANKAASTGTEGTCRDFSRGSRARFNKIHRLSEWKK